MPAFRMAVYEVTRPSTGDSAQLAPIPELRTWLMFSAPLAQLAAATCSSAQGPQY